MTDVLLEYVMFTEIILSTFTLGVMWRKHLLKVHYSVTAFLSMYIVGTIIFVVTLFFRQTLGINKLLDYNIYFYSRWTTFFILSSIMLVIVYSVFRHAMKPLEGLHQAGKVIFKWIFAASLLVSVAIAITSRAANEHYFLKLAGQLQQATSILTLCLLLFVCFATRYLGMTYRSHIFGISLGLGIMATVSLVQSAWFSTMATDSLYSPMYVYSALGYCVALSVWGIYFAMPEPVARMIMLPTTSPYFTWNRISEVLGDHPGHVVIAGFTPEMLAPGELAVLTAASRRDQQIKVGEAARVEAAPRDFALQG